ncbi:putative sec61 protein translocation complex beta subunit, partial [Fasciolopsis buskii]
QPTQSTSSSKSAPTSARGATGGTRQRKAPTATARRPITAPAQKNPVFLFYSEDSPGIKVGPVPVLVMSLCYIVSVFLLHFWGKYTRSS